MLIYPVVVILWLAVTTIATPSANVKQTVDDKKTADYRYGYNIDENNEKGYGKTEMKNGDSASGRYFINGEESYTDVKYVADKLGYHPVVKYRSSNGRRTTTTTTQSTVNRNAEKLQQNETNIENSVKLTGDRQASLDTKSVPIDQNNKSNEKTTFAESSTSITFIKNNKKKINENIKSTLVIENSGSFGKRVPNNKNVNNKQIDDLESSTTKQITSSVTYSTPTISTTTIKPIKRNIKDEKLTISLSNKTRNTPTNRLREYLSSSTSTTTTTTTTTTSLPVPSSSPAPAPIRLSVRKVLRNRNLSHNKPDKRKTDNNKSIDNLNNNKLPEIVSESKVSNKFEKPIVVGEVPSYEYSTTFPCTDDNNVSVTKVKTDIDSESSTVNYSLNKQDVVTQKFTDYDRITTSSLILNPIQAGVSLINLDETHSTVEEPQASVSQTPFITDATITSFVTQPIQEINKITTELPTISTTEKIIDNEWSNKIENLIEVTSQSTFNQDINISQPNPTESSYENIYSDNISVDQTPSTTTPTYQDDSSFEIQKSVELYHNSPVEEIHYPGQAMPQVFGNDYNKNFEYFIQQQQQKQQDQHDQQQQYYDQRQQKQEYHQEQQQQQQQQQQYHQQQQQQQGYQHDQQQQQHQQQQQYVTYNQDELQSMKNTNKKREESFISEQILQELHTSPEILFENLNKHIEEFNDSHEATITHENNLQKIQNNTENVNYSESQEINQPTYVAEVDHVNTNIIKNTNNQNNDKLIINNNYQEFISSTALPEQQQQQTKQTIESSISSTPSNSIYFNTIGQNLPINTANNNYNKNIKNKPVEVTIEQSYSIPFDDIVDKKVIKYQFNQPQNNQYFVQPQNNQFFIHPQNNPANRHQYYQPEKMIENSVHMFNTVDKKNVFQIPSQSYSIGIPLRSQQYKIDDTKYIENSLKIPTTYVNQYQVGYQQQQLNKQQNSNINLKQYNTFNQQLKNFSQQNNQYYNFQRPTNQYDHMMYQQTFNKRYATVLPQQKLNNNYQQIINNKQGQIKYPQLNNIYQLNPYQIQSNYLTNNNNNNQVIYQNKLVQVEKKNQQYPVKSFVQNCVNDLIENNNNNNIEYHGPVPLPQIGLNHHQENQVVHPANQDTLRYLANSPRFNSQTFLRRTRLPDTYYPTLTSNFRQSKMEYGFKPPMVPSIQYDEQTATQIEH